MLMDITVMDREALAGKVLVVHTSVEGQPATMEQIAAFQARNPDLKANFMVLVAPKSVQIKTIDQAVADLRSPHIGMNALRSGGRFKTIEHELEAARTPDGDWEVTLPSGRRTVMEPMVFHVLFKMLPAETPL